MPNCQPPPECTGLDVVFHISLPNIESLLVEIGSTSWNVEDGHKDYEMECNLLNIEYSGRYIYIYNNKVPRMSYPLHNIMYMNWNVPREEFINTPTT